MAQQKHQGNVKEIRFKVSERNFLKLREMATALDTTAPALAKFLILQALQKNEDIFSAADRILKESGLMEKMKKSI